MIKLSETENHSVIALLQPRNYTGVHNKLSQLLTKDESVFFSRPEPKGYNTVWWCTADAPASDVKILYYDQLTQNEQDEVSDILEDQKAQLTSKLSRESEFIDILENLFTIPSNDDIAVLKSEMEFHPVLTRWGCKLANTLSEVDPLKLVIERPRPKRPVVTVKHQYSDGLVMAEEKFVYGFRNIEKQYKSNIEGEKNLGRFQIGETFKISLVDDSESENLFTVSEEGEYIAIFPKFSPASIKIFNQNGELLTHTDVLVTYKQETLIYNSGNSGIIEFESLEVGKDLIIAEKDNPDNSRTFTIN